jgi:hypothetical protein
MGGSSQFVNVLRNGFKTLESARHHSQLVMTWAE